MEILVESGKYCFNSLGKQFYQALEKHELDSCNAKIIIYSPASFPLLWEFIYTGSPLEKPNADLFWGTRHQIIRILTGNSDTRICRESAKRFLFCQNRNLVSSNVEKIAIEELSRSNDVNFFLLEDVFEKFSGDMPTLPDKVLRAWAAGNFDFIHIASHLESPTDERGIQNSKIKLTITNDEINMSLKHLGARYDLEEFKLLRTPLVFLNACKTMTNPDLLSNGQGFPRTLLKFGAGAVIATACDVPDFFANEFAKKYYEFLFQSQSGWWDALGEALRKTREYFLHECKNPLGLAYGLYTQYDY